MLTPERLVEVIVKRRAGATSPLLVYWFQVLANRDEFARRVKAVGAPGIVVLILRGDGFTNPNALLSDVNKLLVVHRGEVEQAGHPQDGGALVILLLSKTAFEFPQLSSPTVL